MKYQLTYTFFETEEQAKAFCDNENQSGTAYKRNNKRAHFTPLKSVGGKSIFIAFYYYK